ncbi:hypothetical protein VPMG_00031 [Vibrio phage VBP32]|uniref:Uncharacterized protein n=2 Tax=Stoningtonvirus VBP47 TaxID=2846606 RepID=M4SQR7_9CAUD|nr:hypothetical protein VPNG_00097 [Vibrio phage VBP47]YP_007676521.1 hypothetical protein VPMG_00031 [Vibrio phage VBP32]AGH57121.1 hypothetical protein VPNG_00097 [Vibrio phage VBP47]AGH57170.1 hypothetical protein VPMG_00031 [Vibrio phage VBP32]
MRPPSLLNEELYMLKLNQMATHEVNEEYEYAKLMVGVHRRHLEEQQMYLYEDRIRCIDKYRQMEDLLNV